MERALAVVNRRERARRRRSAARSARAGRRSAGRCSRGTGVPSLRFQFRSSTSTTNSSIRTKTARRPPAPRWPSRAPGGPRRRTQGWWGSDRRGRGPRRPRGRRILAEHALDRVGRRSLGVRSRAGSRSRPECEDLSGSGPDASAGRGSHGCGARCGASPASAACCWRWSVQCHRGTAVAPSASWVSRTAILERSMPGVAWSHAVPIAVELAFDDVPHGVLRSVRRRS